MLSNIRNLNRWQAFGIHLGISGLIFLALLTLIVFFWYPGVFIHMGGWQGIKIVAGVDLVLGPLLTLIVFNPAKKSLKIDLVVIALFQSSCLLYGVFLVYNEKPLIQVLTDDGVYVLARSDLKAYEITLDRHKWANDRIPTKIYLDLPDDPIKRLMLKMASESTTKKPIYLRDEYYIAFTESTQEQIRKRISLYAEKEDANCYWLPIFSKHFNGKGCFSLEEGIVMLDPPKADSNAKVSIHAKKPD